MGGKFVGIVFVNCRFLFLLINILFRVIIDLMIILILMVLICNFNLWYLILEKLRILLMRLERWWVLEIIMVKLEVVIEFKFLVFFFSRNFLILIILFSGVWSLWEVLVRNLFLRWFSFVSCLFWVFRVLKDFLSWFVIWLKELVSFFNLFLW